MAYRLEKEANDKEAIVIDGFDKGVATDPYSGLGYALGVNIEVPGEISVGYPLTANTISGATLGKPVSRSTRWFAYGSPGAPTGSPQSFAILDDAGQVWEKTSVTGNPTFLSSSNSTTNSSNLDGICYWMGYLWKTRGAAVDYWNGSTWATGWAGLTLTATVKHKMYVASDNVMYITNGNYLASVTAPSPTSFDPTNSTTYSASPTKLQAPAEDMFISIGEVGGGNAPQSTLLLGGLKNYVYPWDKISSSFGLPIVVADPYVVNIVSANQNAFIFTGRTQGRGRIYITNGSQADVYYKIPDFIFGTQDPYFEWGDAIFVRNNLVFSFYPETNSASLIQNFGYVWALELESKRFRAIIPLPTTATFVGNATCLLDTGNLSTPGFGIIVGSEDGSGSSPSIGYSGTAAGIGSGSILTDLLPIGSFMQKKTFSQLEFKLRSPLQSGETLSITPFTDGSAGSAVTFTPTIAAGSISGYANVNFQNNQWLQFLVAMTGNSASSGVRLKEIRLR